MSDNEVITATELYQPKDEPQVFEMSMCWTAARALLELPVLLGRLDIYCDDATEMIDSSVLNESWTPRQRKIIEVAMSLANGNHSVNLGSVLQDLGNVLSRDVADALIMSMATVTVEIL